jgi:hypothetical protein
MNPRRSKLPHSGGNGPALQQCLVSTALLGRCCCCCIAWKRWSTPRPAMPSFSDICTKHCIEVTCDHAVVRDLQVLRSGIPDKFIHRRLIDKEDSSKPNSTLIHEGGDSDPMLNHEGGSVPTRARSCLIGGDYAPMWPHDGVFQEHL